MMLSFHPQSLYPELDQIACHLDLFRKELNQAMYALKSVQDNRAKQQTWNVLPLVIEEEDHGFASNKEISRFRELVPETCLILDNITSVKAYAFSILEKGATIAKHKHQNPYVTAILCLECEENKCFITVNNETQYFSRSQWIIFDYTQMHEVANTGSVARIALLVLLPNRLNKNNSWQQLM